MFCYYFLPEGEVNATTKSELIIRIDYYVKTKIENKMYSE